MTIKNRFLTSYNTIRKEKGTMEKENEIITDTLIIENRCMDLSSFKEINSEVTVTFAHKKMVIMNANKIDEDKNYYYLIKLDKDKKVYDPKLIELIKNEWKIMKFTEFFYYRGVYYADKSYI